jgi:hypothetical protein
MEGLPGTEAVPLRWSVDAMNAAADRAAKVGWNEPVMAFAATAETLWWIGVVHEQVRDNYPDVYEQVVSEESPSILTLLNGLRYARNRVTHAVDEVRYLEGRALGPDGFGAAWFWQSVPPRVDGRQPDEHDDYEKIVAGKLVQSTLVRALRFLRTAAWRAE